MSECLQAFVIWGQQYENLKYITNLLEHKSKLILIVHGYFCWFTPSPNCTGYGGQPVCRVISRFNIKMPSYQYRDSYHKDKTVSRPSYLYNANPRYCYQGDMPYCDPTAVPSDASGSASRFFNNQITGYRRILFHELGFIRDFSQDGPFIVKTSVDAPRDIWLQAIIGTKLSLQNVQIFFRCNSISSIKIFEYVNQFRDVRGALFITRHRIHLHVKHLNVVQIHNETPMYKPQSVHLY